MDSRIEKRIYKRTLTKRLTRNLAGVNQLPSTHTSRSRQGLAKPIIQQPRMTIAYARIWLLAANKGNNLDPSIG
ncbi:MAG: hypothetical protein LQ343_005283 [Gyalolechia ehrenbergii]|nr:MAG: hypothetical protein LQ343_005283 [Gyalolechia ehrenbergii]